MKVAVKWDNVNALDIEMLMNMAEDGYEFLVQDGKIDCVLMCIGV